MESGTGDEMNQGYNARITGLRTERMGASADMWERIQQERDEARDINRANLHAALFQLAARDPNWFAWFDTLPDWNLYDTDATNRVLVLIRARTELVVNAQQPVE